MHTVNYYAFADGASKGNPGDSSIGAICMTTGECSLAQYHEKPDSIIFEISEKIGKKTNNEAEYMALIKLLETFLEKNILKATIFMDSELVIRQITGVYKVKKEHLQKLFQQVQNLIQHGQFTFKHIPREKNQIADFLANKALK